MRQVAVIVTGRLGAVVILRSLSVEHRVTVSNRTRSAAEVLTNECGADVAA
jgi:3-hydroxyisobutyrate dehydrogenase-like beta-hydroxyacid dehydrogenase